MWKSIAGLWIINVILVCAPFFGFGLWYNENAPGKCARFRDGRDPIDRAYAFLFFTFGKLRPCCWLIQAVIPKEQLINATIGLLQVCIGFYLPSNHAV